MYVSRLSTDFTDIERPVEEGKSWSRILVNKQREAPAPFKYKNKYYLITSGLTGWSPNAAMYAVADHILGPYEIKGDPCLGADANSTFFSQSTFVLPVAGAPEGSFVFMADRWNGTELEKSRYVWLPFTVKNGKVSILNIPSWDKSIFDTLELKSFEKSKFSIRYDSVGHQIVWQPLAGAHLYAVIKNGEIVGSTAATSYTIPPSLYGHSFNYQIIAQNIQQKQVFSQNHLVLEDSRAKRISLNSIAPDYYTQGFGILKYNKNMDEGQMVIANKVFENGLGTHPPSVLKYYLGGHYKRLSIGMGHTTTPAPMSKVGFEIRGDGQVIYKSQPMTEANPAVFVDLDISGICELELLVNDGGDGSHYDHAAWVDGILER